MFYKNILKKLVFNLDNIIVDFCRLSFYFNFHYDFLYLHWDICTELWHVAVLGEEDGEVAVAGGHFLRMNGWGSVDKACSDVVGNASVGLDVGYAII